MKNFYFLLLAFLISNLLQGQQLPPLIEWQKCLGGTQDEMAQTIIRSFDNGFLVGGSSQSDDGDITGHHGSTDSTDAWVVKLSETGAVEWQKSYGGSGNDAFTKIIATADGNYICFGTTTSNDGDVSSNHGAEDLWVVKIDRYGDIIWEKSLGGSDGEMVGNIREQANGNLLVIGSTRSNDGDVSGNHGGGASDIWVVKLDGSGNILGQGCIGGTDQDFGSDIAESDNGNMIIAIEVRSTDGDFSGLTGQPPLGMVAKIDPSFSVVWYDVMSRTIAKSITPTANPGQYIITYDATACYPMNATFGVATVLLQEPASSGGNPTRTNLINYDYCEITGSAYGYRVEGANTHTFLNATDQINIATYDTLSEESSPHGEYDGFIGSYKNNGSPNWRKYIGGSDLDHLTAVVAISETEFVVAGYTKSNDDDVSGNHGGYDYWVVKLGKNNLIKGTVFQDFNANGVKDINEPLVDNILVQSEKGVSSSASITQLGVFSNSVDTGQYVTRVIHDWPYYTVTPVSKNTSFTDYNNTDSFSFALQPIPGQRDYEVMFLPPQAARPGFEVYYTILVGNRGTDTLTNKTVKLVRDPRLTYMSATPAETSVSGDTIYWNISSLLPRDSMYIFAGFTAAVPPDLNIDDTLMLEVYIDSTDDVKPSDNSAYIRQVVTGSFDPNDKQEIRSGAMFVKEVIDSKYLLYTIRFQNTGTDTAFTVVIKDTLEERLYHPSFEMISASHDFSIQIKDGNVITWTFKNILLPDSNVNEPASHGYVTYRVRPVTTLAVGDTIRNRASIYFDFNLPVVTNTQETIIEANPVKVLPPPPTPVITGLQSSYCNLEGIQQAKITNLPAAGGEFTTAASLDGYPLLIASDSTCAFNPDTLAQGQHEIIIYITNGSDTAWFNHSFSVVIAVTPELDLSASNPVITDLSVPVIVTAINITGGGGTPQFVFARDRLFNDIVQAESVLNTWTFNPSILAVGENWIYVRIRTSETCFVQETAIDSIKLTRSPLTGVYDPDFPNTVITVFPNPFDGEIVITGLSQSKTYAFVLYDLHGRRVAANRTSNRSVFRLERLSLQGGLYWLTIYDEKRKRLLGSVRLVKQ